MKPLRIALVLAFLGISAGIIWCLCMSAPAKVVLPGGVEMRTLKVSLGGTHVLSFEPIWKRFLRRVFPEALQKSILGPFQGRYAYTLGEALVVWVDAPGPSAGLSFVLESAAA